MLTIINHTHVVYPTVAAAEAQVAAFAAQIIEFPDLDDGWTYVVVADPTGTGKAIIEVYDEDAFKVGLL